MTKPFKNVITDWELVNQFGNALIVRGTAMFYQDGVVDAGQVLNTSKIVNMRRGPHGYVVETFNSIYLLV